MFTTATGGHRSGSSETHRFQARLKEAGLPLRSFHELRRGAASLLPARGASMRTVMEQLGHSQISLTANLYTHLIPALRRDASERMERVLTG